MQQLNPAQRDAVRYTDGPLLVLAGAGSGKTGVITRKIAHLIRERGVPPQGVIAVTFTNKAAREMRERVGRLLDGRDGEGLSVSTFHTLGLHLLRREHRHSGLRSNFSILDARDAAELVRELAAGSGAEGRELVRHIHNQISSWKNDLVDPGQALSHAADEAQARAARVYAEYNRKLRAFNAVDFDDLIGLPVALLRENAELRGHWQARLRHLLVDEYQDTNNAQYELVRLLVGNATPFTAVGDDDQSIYAWRGARPENLGRLQRDFPRLKVVKLEQNYRSTGTILKAANRLIAHNPHVFEKKLWSRLGAGEAIRVVECRDDEQEPRQVTSELVVHKFRNGTRFGDYAILYRSNHQSRALEQALREQNVPYVVSGGMSFFDHAEVKDVLAYLRLLANPHDDAAFLRIANVPRRGIGAGTLEALAGYAAKRHRGLLAACTEMGLGEHLGEQACSRLRRLAHMLEDLAKLGERDPLGALKGLLAETGFMVWLRENADNPRQGDRRVANVEELVNWLSNLVRQDGDRSLADLVNHMALMDMQDRNGDDEAGDRVQLMTLHAAKGLEFPHVFLVGMEEGLLPHHSSLEEDNVEEERRLAYVGITRARQTLTLSYARKRRRFGEWEACRPSRFLDELPQELLQWSGGRREEADPQARQERGRAHLANLRALLSDPPS